MRYTFVYSNGLEKFRTKNLYGSVAVLRYDKEKWKCLNTYVYVEGVLALQWEARLNVTTHKMKSDSLIFSELLHDC